MAWSTGRGGQFPADGTGTRHGRNPWPPTPALGHRIPGLDGRGPTQTHTHALISLFPGKQMQEVLWLLPSPFFTPLRPRSGLLLQPCPTPCPVSPCEVPGDARGAHAGAGRAVLRCASSPVPPSGIFAPPPEAWRQPGQTRPFTHYPPRIPTTIP